MDPKTELEPAVPSALEFVAAAPPAPTVTV
jgi:hypothetical protein